ncbi:hypothetical protein HZA40_03740 [Candidatus Peregrinibacteria bacterium]|nr:hypothetical protein [Candidatus Peregrinibacteria bacterium]
MYQRRYYQPSRRQASRTNYVMPFLIIICVGVIGVLLFNLWRAFFPSEKAKAAYLHIVQGSAQMKAWGTDSFFNLTTDSVVMQGDRIRSSADAKFIVEFFDGTLMRTGGNVDISFDKIDDKGSSTGMDLHLYAGDIWFDMMNRSSGHADVEVTMNNVVAKSNQASVFDIENDGDQVVRVVSVFQNSGLGVDVLDKDSSKVVETENVGIGQQIDFSADVLKAYWNHQSPTVLAAISDDFKQSDWYLWNLKEDNSPTVFEKTIGPGGVPLVKVAPQTVAPAVAVTPDVPSATNLDGTPIVSSDSKTATATEITPAKTDTTKTTSPADSNTVGKPVITSVADDVKPDALGKYQVTSRVTTLSGTIKGATKVVVNGYTLTKFKAGDANWNYYANADFGLMKAGENTYEIYGLDDKGKKGESLVLKVVYTPQAVVPAAPSVTTTPAAKTATAPAASSP